MKITNKKILGICVFLVFLSSFFIFGFLGVKTILVIIMLFFLPSYSILSYFKLEEDEKIFFSFFIGLGLFPLAVWYVDRMLVSLKLSTVLTFLIVVSVGVFLNRKKLISFFKNKK